MRARFAWIVRVGFLMVVAVRILSSTPPVRRIEAEPRVSSLAAGGATSGLIEICSFNVAGLPDLVAPGDADRLAAIGGRLAAHDLVLLQEDFYHHEALVAALARPMSVVPPAPGTLFGLGDGLARFSGRELGPVDHVAWELAHGVVGYFNDELAAKGFAVGAVSLEPGVTLQVYNLHADAGDDDGDREARRHQFRQLAADLRRRLPGREAVIVVGDFNADPRVPADRELLDQLCADCGLRDAAAELGVGEGIDRLLYRSSDRLHLEALRFGRADELGRADGRALSDHEAVAVLMRWRLRPGRAEGRGPRLYDPARIWQDLLPKREENHESACRVPRVREDAEPAR